MFCQASWVHVDLAVSKPPELHESVRGSPGWCIQRQVCVKCLLLQMWCVILKKNNNLATPRFFLLPNFPPDGCLSLLVFGLGEGRRGGIWRRQSIAWLPILLSSYLSSYFSFCSSSSSSCSSCSFSFLLVLQMCLFMCKARWSDLEKHLWRNIEMFLLISKEKHEICMWNESLGKAGDEFLKMNLKKELYKWQMCSSAKAQLALFRCIFALK